ncbi:MAG: NAD(P)/FAD-dependent oxidoreductase [Clostridia bacterium]|nr:NAD(P)/FAD-dependent oxidoreductase [Clostridia bacterium]
MYDVAIIGCGITGSACAYFLSKYSLKIAIIEKKNDVCCGTTRANSAIIHAGYDPIPGTLCAKYNVRGNLLTKEICKKLDVLCKEIGSLVLAFSDEEKETLKELYERGIKNGVPDMEIWDGDRIRREEPNVSENAVAALYAPTAAIVNPWEYGLAMAETAVRNGAELMLNSEVKSISKADGGWKIETGSGSVEAKYVINAAGVYTDIIHNMVADKSFEIIPNAGEYYLLDKCEGERVSHVIFQCPDKNGKGVLVAPTVHGNLIVGPNAVDSDRDDTATRTASLDFVRTSAVKSVPSINFRENIRNFTGVRANADTGDFVIGFAAENFLDLAGIKSPGLSAAPAIAEDAVRMLKEKGLELREKENFIDTRRHLRFNELSDEKKNEVIARNPLYGRVVCRCETITEGEIVDALASPIKPVSLDGVKRRAGTGMGRCQGGFCGPKVLEIIARSNNITFEDVLQDDTGSYILTGETKNGGAK